ncbi:Zinc finger, BED-type [Trema orientale]|uniref:Zinc finger, BED-type n=1 Tax=Trema orientale TaxID=63057 RepID=A0A2P5FF45_TREOI|nr:Zinc finger, BED-type [Trema orientale]
MEEVADTPTEIPTQNENPIPTQNETKRASRKRGRPRIVPKKGSSIWEHFTKIEECDPNDPRCLCNYYGNDYACDTKKHGTSSLWHHYRKAGEKSTYKVEEKKQKTLSFEPKKGGKEGEVSLVAVQYNKEACRQAVSRYIMLDELPFRHIEGEWFRQLIRTLQPRFELPSRMTVARDIMKMYYDEINNLKSVIRKERVSITIDT